MFVARRETLFSVRNATLWPGTGDDLLVTLKRHDTPMTGFSSLRQPRARRALFASPGWRHWVSLVRGEAVLVPLVDLLLILHACDRLVAPLVAPLQVNNHAPAQGHHDNPRGDDERQQGIMRKQMRELPRVSETGADKVAADHATSGNADSTDHQAGTQALPCS
jgi:hypothetical protein